MTSVVTISAHCGDAKEVHVVATEAGSLIEEFNIANGEKAERYAYDDRVIAVREVVKIDRRAKEIEDAEFSLRQATLRYEDAASRGFHMGNKAALAADVEVKQAELDALLVPPDLPVFTLTPINAATIFPLSAGNYETKTYSDGTAAAGSGPLPEQSPAQQDTEAVALTPEARTFLDSLDPAPFAEPTGDADPSLAPTEPYPEPT